MADSMDFSKQQLTPTGTDKVLVVRTDTEYGHETLTDIVKEMVTDPITDPIATRVTAIEDAIGSEETGSESGILKRVKANETNISTNTDNIATNASNISALQTGLANTNTEVAKKAPQETTYTKAEVDNKETTLENEIALKANSADVTTLLLSYMKFPIVADAGFHNSIYRGKDISSYWNDGTIHSRIQGANGYALFEDLFVGDYFTTGSATINGTTKTWYWVIAGFDLRLNIGDSEYVSSHHAVLLPCTSDGQGADIICSSAMYSSVPFTTGYVSSLAHALMTSGAIATGLKGIFGSNLITSREYLSTSNNSSGVTTGASWQTCYAVLPSEVEAYGTNVWSSGLYGGMMDSRGQLPLFRLKPSMISSRSSSLWLRSVGESSSYFAYVTNNGFASSYSASNSVGLRPRFLIK